MKKIFKRIIDNRESDSLATQLRRRRFSVFERYLSEFNRPIKILDIGGVDIFWMNMGYANKNSIQIDLLNNADFLCNHSNIKYIKANALDLSFLENNSYDIVFSNSLIEHLSNYKNQYLFARQVQRISNHYFIQTPNKYFPIEPHFIFPFFHFLPNDLKILLLTSFNLGWFEKIQSKEEAKMILNQFNMLSKGDLLSLFPNSTLFIESFFGFEKSFIVYK